MPASLITLAPLLGLVAEGYVQQHTTPVSAVLLKLPPRSGKGQRRPEARLRFRTLRDVSSNQSKQRL